MLNTTQKDGISISLSGILSETSSGSSAGISVRSLPQVASPEIIYYSDIQWIPRIISHLPSNEGTYDAALSVLEKLNGDIPFGGSPLYDSLVECSSILISTDDRQKIIYVLTDNEPNVSLNDPISTLEDIQSIDGTGKVPLIINNFSIVYPVTLSALAARTESDSIDKLATATGGQSISVLSGNFLDEIINRSIGKVIGSVGYGTFEYTIDLGEEGIIAKIELDSNVFPNTESTWKFSSGLDSVNLTEFSESFQSNLEINFDNLVARFIRFQVTLVSGLSVSTDETYDDVSTSGVPSISRILITHAVPKSGYMFINKEDLLHSPQQVILSANVSGSNMFEVQGGVSSENTYNWESFSSASQPLIGQDGKVFIPIRSRSETDNNINENMHTKDRFVYKTTYGKWQEKSNVSIYNNGVLVASSNYKTYPTDGLIVFASRQSPDSDFTINIDDQSELRAAFKFVNKDYQNPLLIEGVGYMYNTNVFLQDPLNLSKPVALDVFIAPVFPTSYATISIHYTYSDVNNKLEDETAAKVRWFVNGVEKDFLNDRRSWNNINDISDPFTFFGPSDLLSRPETVSAEAFARSLDYRLVNVGDKIHCLVSPSNGTVSGDSVRSNTVSIVETVPFVTNVEIRGRKANGAIVDSLDNSVIVFTDYNYFSDSSGNTSIIIWYINGSEFKRGSLIGQTGGLNNNEIIPGEARSGAIAIQIGNTIQVEIIPSTENLIGSSIKSGIKTVANAIPSVILVRLSPLNPIANSSISLTYTFVDSDLQQGDPTQSDQSSIRWFRADNPASVFAEIGTLAGKRAITSDLLLTGQRWRADVTPFDGLSVGESVSSNIITIR